jgi:hypothetical protein
MGGRSLLQQIHSSLHRRTGATVRAVCLGAALIALSGCIAEDKDPVPAAEPPITQSRPLPETPLAAPAKPAQAADARETEPQPDNVNGGSDGTGRPVWAEGFAGQMVQGLDGGVYPAYQPATIRRVQSVLKERSLYSGPINGVLDRPTMASIYAFQEATYALQRCGVPTPRTRKLLEQGSHTDAA